MIRWIEANGYDVSYSTGVDTDRRGAELLEHDIFLSVGHDEYWSAAQRANVEAARDAGVNLAFFSGNEVFWKTRWEDSIDASGDPYRTLVTYKTSKDGVVDPTGIWTGTWRDTQNGGGQPENALTGTIYQVNAFRFDTIEVSDTEGKLRFWRDTSLANLARAKQRRSPTRSSASSGTSISTTDFGPPNSFRFRPPRSRCRRISRISETGMGQELETTV